MWFGALGQRRAGAQNISFGLRHGYPNGRHPGTSTYTQRLYPGVCAVRCHVWPLLVNRNNVPDVLSENGSYLPVFHGPARNPHLGLALVFRSCDIGLFECFPGFQSCFPLLCQLGFHVQYPDLDLYSHHTSLVCAGSQSPEGSRRGPGFQGSLGTIRVMDCPSFLYCDVVDENHRRLGPLCNPL